MKKVISIFISAVLISALFLNAASAQGQPSVERIKAAILMEKVTGEILFEYNAHTALPPASITKIMTLLLVFEAIDSGRISMEDMVSASEAACRMGGSQIWLEPGEEMSVSELIKTVAVVSANDSSVALAEHIAGSEESFVQMMNERAKQLGMNDTVFINCTGLDADGHVASAHDVAVMTRELLKHEGVKAYTTIWIDTIRGGEMGLSNTNRLVRYYEGTTGMKTGFTAVAGFCLSATALRGGVEYIAVVMGGETSDIRFESCKKLLDFAFANYTLFTAGQGAAVPEQPVKLGVKRAALCELAGGGQILVDKGKVSSLIEEFDMQAEVQAPVVKGQRIGTYRLMSGGETLAEMAILAAENVARPGFFQVFISLLAEIFMAAKPAAGA